MLSEKNWGSKTVSVHNFVKGLCSLHISGANENTSKMYIYHMLIVYQND